MIGERVRVELRKATRAVRAQMAARVEYFADDFARLTAMAERSVDELLDRAEPELVAHIPRYQLVHQARVEIDALNN